MIATGGDDGGELAGGGMGANRDVCKPACGAISASRTAARTATGGSRTSGGIAAEES